MLSIINNHYIKNTARDVRIGLIESLAYALNYLGPSFIESNFQILFQSIIELVSNPKLSGESEVQFTREMCTFIIRDIIGKSLTEIAQINALKELTSEWLKKFTENPSKYSPNAMVLVLNEISSLLIDLGSASSSVVRQSYYLN
jgi:HEAT repeat-containing protein 5